MNYYFLYLKTSILAICAIPLDKKDAEECLSVSIASQTPSRFYSCQFSHRYP